MFKLDEEHRSLFMIIEIHTHTSEHSPCSKISAVDLVEAVYGQGVSGIVLTDHHYLWQDADLDALRLKCSVPSDFLILAGQEVFTSDFGDVLVFGANKSISKGISLSSIREQYPDAALIWAHPYRSGIIPNEIELFDSSLDAIEIINPYQKKTENIKGVGDWSTWGFTATSGSDIHQVSFAEFFPTHFVGNITDIQGIISCVKEGSCYPEIGKYKTAHSLG